MQHWSEFEYVVVNDDFARAVDELQAIVHGRGAASAASRPQLEPVLRQLLG
jgi:guanylate kinase